MATTAEYAPSGSDAEPESEGHTPTRYDAAWDWVLANLQPHDDTTPDRNPRPEREHQIEDWTDEDYRRLGFDDPPPDVNT